ncbi:hypothetical protein [Burkholderia sp. BCC0405]|uniref:hypothetical protein n=1 Tax=Burkholderia sp. BCC0405 TaxID=2676298 RepID=UPI00158E4677|nr:hypothetical protein [Burkholderia sp. BCC0405]
MTMPSAVAASDVPTAFSTFSVENVSPLDITRPEYAEHADDDETVCAGLALHAMFSAGVLAKAGATSISASTEIGVRTVIFIGGPRRNCVSYMGSEHDITRGTNFRAPLAQARVPGKATTSTKSAAVNRPTAPFDERPLTEAHSTSGA